MFVTPLQSSRDLILVIVCVWAAVMASDARAEMQLLYREMFGTAGQLDAGSPGANFTEVTGSLHMRPGGPRLSGGAAASADLRGTDTPVVGTFTFADAPHRRLFAGGWFLIKEASGAQFDLLSLTDPFGNMSPTISITYGKLGTGIRYNSFTEAEIEWKNRWVYLGVAAHLKSGSTADVRFYYKFPGQPMQSLGQIEDGSIGISSFGRMLAGCWAYGNSIKGRMGAPSAYTFEEDDFSDVAYPADVIEPGLRSTWYCDPQNGNDSADGTTPQTAWRSMAKVNLESFYTGMLPATSIEEGDTLIVNTGEALLDLEGMAWEISTPGLNVKAAPGQEWIRLKSYRSLPSTVWQPTSIPHVFSTSDTQSHIVLWENDKFMHHPVGAAFSDVQAGLSATPGSFWTDGNTLYVHPFGSTDPRTDGKRYERSYLFTAGAAVILNAANLNVQDIHAGKTCLAHAETNDPIGGYCMGFANTAQRTVVKHAYLYYGSKHNIGLVQGGPGDDVLLEDVQCEQGSPYAGAGGQTLFVSFNHQPLDLGITHRFHRCRSVANAGLIGSAAGIMTQLYPVFYVHNLGGLGEPDQFDRFEFIDCDFGTGNIQGDAVKKVYLEGTTCGYLTLATDVTAYRCVFNGMNEVAEGSSLLERNCIHIIKPQLRWNPVAGAVDIQGCTVDARQITEWIHEAALFTRAGDLELIFRNNLILLPANVPNISVFSHFRSSDSLELGHNAYQTGLSSLAYQFQDGVSPQNQNLSQWQARGYDENSFQAVYLELQDLRPLPGSPLVNAGLDISPLQDHSGHLFQRRNDIGAFEAPAVTFEDWQVENFSPEELAEPGVSKPEAGILDDGQKNLLKYGLGLSAGSSKSDPLKLKLQTSPPVSSVVIHVEYERSRWASDLTCLLKTSTDLVKWTPADIENEQVIDQSANSEVIRSSVIAPLSGPLFFKLEIGLTSSSD